jgi:hypothetical protein
MIEDYAEIGIDLVDHANPSDRRTNTKASEIVGKGIALAALRDADAGAEYLRANEIPLRIAHRVLAMKQRRSGDWTC